MSSAEEFRDRSPDAELWDRGFFCCNFPLNVLYCYEIAILLPSSPGDAFKVIQEDLC